MGNIRDWAQQAAGTPAVGYEKNVFFPWAAIVHGVDPSQESGGAPSLYGVYDNFFDLDDGGTFNIATELYFLRDENGGNPYNISAYDPSNDIRDVEDALRGLSRNINDYRAETHLSESVRIAIDQVRELLGDDTIDDVVAAETARMQRDYLQSKSSLMMDLWMSGGILVTQTAGDLALLEDGFNREIAAYAAKLRNAREDQRAQFALQLTGMALQNKDRRSALQQIYVAAALDVLKVKMTASQDQIDKNLEYDIARKFHNVSLLQLALNANSAIYGAQMVPRSQTKGERLTAAVMSSASMGIQGGMAMGSPGAGLAMGGLNMLTQLIG